MFLSRTTLCLLIERIIDRRKMKYRPHLDNAVILKNI